MREGEKSVYEYKGQMHSLAKSQQGSKFLQRVLAKASPDVVDFVVEEVGDHMHELMTDSYGNYFCQKLLQSSSSHQRMELLRRIMPHIIKISCDKRGTHSMQSLIEMINMAEEEEIVQAAIVNDVIFLAYEPHGTHVLQKLITCLKPERLDYVFEPIFKSLVELALDANGLCVVKKIISRFDSGEKKRLLVNVLTKNAVNLVQSPYGNYAIQQAIERWTNEDLQSIYDNLLKHVLQLSMQKFSSNVIEKCLEKAEHETVMKFVRAISNQDVMKSLIKNNYGFYVVQKLFTVVQDDSEVCELLGDEIERNLTYVSDKSLRQKWMSLLR